MSGLAEILEENQRLREALALRDRALADSHQALVDSHQALADRVKERDDALTRLAAVQEQAEHLARTLQLLELSAGGPSNERYVPVEQEMLPFSSEVTAPPRLPEPETEPKTTRKKRKARRRNLEDSTHPKQTVRCPADPSATCAGCGGSLRVFDQATTRRMEWVPGHFVVQEFVRDKCSCPRCPSEGVLTVPAPCAIPRGLCGDGLLTRVLVDKFADHVPLNRQVRRMKREGFETNTSTLSGWVAAGAGLLGIVARAVRKQTFGSSFLLGDDSGLPVQDGGGSKVRKGRLWAFTDQQQAFYAFSPSKHGEHPVALLDGFDGELLLVDGGSEFNEVVRELGLERAGCWSHLRRYFFKARVHHPVEAGLALATIRDLFMVEREAKDLAPNEVIALRQAKSKPLVDGFFAWVQALSTTVRPKSSLGDAVTYARNQEATMRLFLEHGQLPIHNNLSELMLRQPIVGRKNWLFAGSQGGAKAACTMFTLVGSCMLQGIDPDRYLRDVFRVLPDHPANRVGELTPLQWRLRQGHTPIGL